MEAHNVGPAAKRYTRIVWIGALASIFIGGLIAIPLRLSSFITMGVPVLILLLVTIPLGRAAARERKRWSDGN